MIYSQHAYEDIIANIFPDFFLCIRREAVEFAINKAIVLKLRANAYQISGHIGSKATDGSLVNWNYHKIDLNPVSYPPASRKAGDV